MSQNVLYTIYLFQAVQKVQDNFKKLLYRYLCSEIGKINAIKLLPQYSETLRNLEEMANILATKRLRIWRREWKNCDQAEENYKKIYRKKNYIYNIYTEYHHLKLNITTSTGKINAVPIKLAALSVEFLLGWGKLFWYLCIGSTS